MAEPVRASKSASRSVTETDSPSKAVALICCTGPACPPTAAPARRSTRRRRRSASARGRREAQARSAPDSLGGSAEEGAGDAHVVVVTYITKLEAVPSRCRQRKEQRQGVGAHDVRGEGAQGHGVALQLKASHREAGRGHGALAVGAHQKIAQRGECGLQQHLTQGGQRDVVGPSVKDLRVAGPFWSCI